MASSSHRVAGAGTFKGTGKVSSLRSIYNSLDSYFKGYIDGIVENNGNGSCLLRLLKLSEGTQVLTHLLEVLLEKYNADEDKHYFDINGNHLNITLEDVLFVTGLPIKGKPVISNISRDPEAPNRVFGLPTETHKLTLTELKKIVKDTNIANDKRLVALLLIVVGCFIVPCNDTHFNLSCYLQFVEKLDQVSNYAWGAALLAFLYCELDEINKKRSVGGNLWVLLDITWHPYNKEWLIAPMQDELPYVTHLAPVFCMSYVAHHRPLSFINQFKVLGKFLDQAHCIKWKPQQIHRKLNTGNSNQDFKKIYAKHLLLWDKAESAEEYIEKTLNVSPHVIRGLKRKMHTQNGFQQR